MIGGPWVNDPRFRNQNLEILRAEKVLPDCAKKEEGLEELLEFMEFPYILYKSSIWSFVKGFFFGCIGGSGSEFLDPVPW